MKRIIQITDTHIFAEPDDRLLGHDTAESLSLVVNAIMEEESFPDVVLLTGDMVQALSTESYLRLLKLLEPIHVPIYCLYGNHDSSEFYPENIKLRQEKLINLNDWNIVMLNSQVEGEVQGKLDSIELRYLNQSLTAYPDKPTLIAMHHQPVDVGSKWIDNIGLSNKTDFYDVINQHNNVKAVIWGHVHQAYDQIHNHIRHLACPSTCIQFMPKSNKFSLDTDRAPGYRWLELHEDGSLQTGLVRLDDFNYQINEDANGY